MSVRRASVHELAGAWHERYWKADRAGKGRLLDEFVATTGCHRKTAIRLLRDGPPKPEKGRGGRPGIYSAGVVDGLRVAAAASGWACGKRLAPFLAELVPALATEGALRLSEDERELLVGMSAATVDRRLAPYRRGERPRGLGTTKPGALLKRQVPVRTFTPWEDERAGFLEIDLVAHCGTSTAGFYLNTLTETDVATGWTELVAVWGKGQAAVLGGQATIRERLPFPLLGLDSDNGAESLNDRLLRYCEREGITFTRSRPYWKNDQAHVEQKNWSAVRKEVGYDRYTSEAALARLNRVYGLLRIWLNHWQPALKLVGKERDGAKVRKKYDTAKTPYRRVLESGALTDEARRRLEEEHAAWGPLALRKAIDRALADLWSLAERQPVSPGPTREDPPSGQPTNATIDPIVVHSPVALPIEATIPLR